MIKDTATTTEYNSTIMVKQLEDSIFWAGSCPVARNTAVTILDACALKPLKILYEKKN